MYVCMCVCLRVCIYIYICVFLRVHLYAFLCIPISLNGSFRVELPHQGALASAMRDHASASVEGEAPPQVRCKVCGDAEEAQAIFDDFRRAVSSVKLGGAVTAPMRISTVEELVGEGSKWYNGAVSWGLKKMGM